MSNPGPHTGTLPRRAPPLGPLLRSVHRVCGTDPMLCCLSYLILSYHRSNAVGRLLGTLGSGVIYTYSGQDFGDHAGSDALRGLGACFIAGTASSLVAALITIRIRDDDAGLRCGPCVCVARAETPEVEAAASGASKPAEEAKGSTTSTTSGAEVPAAGGDVALQVKND